MNDCTFLMASLHLNSLPSNSLLRLGYVRLSNQFKIIDLEAEYISDDFSPSKLFTLTPYLG